MRKILLLLTISSTVLPHTCLLRGQTPLACPQVQELLRAPGLRILVSAQREALLPNEVIEPKIKFRNLSSKVLEIPLLDERTTGVAILPLQRRIEPVTGREDYDGHFELSLGMNQGSAAQACAFPRMQLLPGQEKEFLIAKPNPVWMGKIDPDPYFSYARADRPGKEKFLIWLGGLQLTATYELLDVKILSSYCLNDEGSKFLSFTQATKKYEDSCVVVSLVTAANRYYLFSSPTLFKRTLVAEDIRSRNNPFFPVSLQSERLPYPAIGQILAEYDAEPRIEAPVYPKTVKIEEFFVTTPNGRFGVKDLATAYKQARQAEADRYK